ncbi:hypothetical protein HY639_04015 [Candidatus Woesearchaeota archaeon]|nr:hypothetical protein [Candidatus Woesearchaeota archaeon]
MKRGWLCLFLGSSICAAPMDAEVRFQWEDEKTPVKTRRAAEECVKTAARKYMEPLYGDLGAYDFFRAPEIYTVYFGDTDGITAEYFVGSRGGTLFLDKKLTTNPTKIEIIALHELGHAYDWTHHDRGQKKGIQLRQIVAQTEERSLRKEQRYVEEIKDRIPRSLYVELQPRYQKHK